MGKFANKKRNFKSFLELKEATSEVTLTSCHEVGTNGFQQIRDILDEFVQKNFRMLYQGAIRLSEKPYVSAISADYYAPKRVQIRNTRLHQSQDLKIADGHHWRSDGYPSEVQLRQTILDIQELLDAAAENIPAPFVLHIVENKKEEGEDSVKN